jgi:hypothetical protein
MTIFTTQLIFLFMAKFCQFKASKKKLKEKFFGPSIQYILLMFCNKILEITIILKDLNIFSNFTTCVQQNVAIFF